MAKHARFDAIPGRCVIIALATLLGWMAPLAARGNAITDVDQSLLAAIRVDAAPPPVAARDIAMVGIVIYDAVNAATGLTYQPYSYSGGAVSAASADAAAYAAGYTMLQSLFPKQSFSLQSAAASGINLITNDTARNTGVNLGTNVATNFYNARYQTAAPPRRLRTRLATSPGTISLPVPPRPRWCGPPGAT